MFVHFSLNMWRLPEPHIHIMKAVVKGAFINLKFLKSPAISVC